MAVRLSPRSYARQIPRVLGAVFGNPQLRRVELSFAGFNAAEWSVWIAMIVYAYGRGGTTEAGLVAVVQLVPAALFAPFASSLGDRYRPGRVLCGGYVAQACGMGLTAGVLLGGGPAWLAYACAAVAATAVTVTRPTQSALVPALVRTPDELTAANVVSGWIESLTVLVGPVAAGLILSVGSPGWVFAVMAAVTLVSALLVGPVAGPPPADRTDSAQAAVGRAVGLLRHERELRVLVALLAAEFVAVGALDVLYAELAIGVLDRPDSWAAYLNAVYGLGGTLGIAASAALVGRRRLVPALLAGLAVWLGAFVVIGVEPTLAVAMLMLAAAGVAHVVFDSAGRTLLQRVTPNDVLSSVFGILEGLAMAGLAAGSLLAPALVALGGAELAFLGVGLLLPLIALVAGRSLLGVDARADVPVVEIGLLRSLPLFAALPPPTLESLARSLVPVNAAAGTEVIRQGDEGDRFYVVADGVVEVVRDGTVVATLGRGDGFGEIALLRDVPRTATVRAVGPTRLYALDQDDFVPAVTGHPRSAHEADRLVAARSQPHD
jgi:MFS family permease